MRRFIVSAGIAAALFLTGAGRAEARIFEPQRDWWSSGRICVASRSPPGLAWDDLPPRACVSADRPRSREKADVGLFVETKAPLDGDVLVKPLKA